MGEIGDFLDEDLGGFGRTVGVEWGLVDCGLHKWVLHVLRISNDYNRLIMLISTSNYLTAAPLTKDTEKINSIKLDFTKIYFATPSNHGHTSCKHCSGILTEEVGPFSIKGSQYAQAGKEWQVLLELSILQGGQRELGPLFCGKQL